MAITISITIDSNKAQSFLLPVDLETAINSFLLTQVVDGKPKYVDSTALIMANLKEDLFKNVLIASPPPSVVLKQTALIQAQTDLEAAKAAVLP